MDKDIKKVADLIVNSKKVVVFTGAGVSTESGIPDFRSPGGVWDRFDPEEFTYQKFLSSEESRKKYWARSKEFYPKVRDAKPNKAHIAIAELEKLGKLECVITQNVDNLHQKAGNTKVIELHGTALWVYCLNCGKKYSRDEIQEKLITGIEVPRCDDCKGILKVTTISFGEPMPQEATQKAFEISESCDLFIVIGSSLVVFPAAQMPIVAKQSGAKLVIINLSETACDDYADVIIQGKAGEIMEKIVEEIKRRIV